MNLSAEPLWQPSTELLSNSKMASFTNFLANKHQRNFENYQALHKFSVENALSFWPDLWTFLQIKGDLKAPTKLNPLNQFLPYDWFPKSKLNYAENLLKNPSDRPAIISHTEQGHQITLTRQTLFKQVVALAQRMKNFGVQPGDRIAGYLPNSAQAHIAMLATTAIGAVWTSCSPDFGIQSVVDRFSQVSPKILFTVDGYQYKQKVFGLLEKNARICESLPSLQALVLIPNLPSELPEADPDGQTLAQSLAQVSQVYSWSEWLSNALDEAFSPQTFEFETFEFNHPLFILYSSGTTGKPKCIVHTTGGTLIQHLKELVLHTNIQATDRVLYYTSCGWMMWNWAASVLATGATLVLYDGAPLHPTATHLLEIVSQLKVSVFGTSARYIHALKQAMVLNQHQQLKHVQCILSTGSPLAPEDFEYVYQELTSQARLCSISGGTDIISCFVLGNPMLPIYSGEIQCAGLGMAVDVWDDSGHPVKEQKGELVCKQSFPSMPLKFWHDDNNERYLSAYFQRFDQTWAHGDYAQITANQGIIIHGRSDTVLNPQGVRIGTAEIYNPLSQIQDITDSLVTALELPDGDCQIVLFVVPADNTAVRDQTKQQSLTQLIHQSIRNYASPRHVPSYIGYVSDVPKTHSGKLMEVLVRELINGREPKNLSAVANPECLHVFRQWRAPQ